MLQNNYGRRQTPLFFTKSKSRGNTEITDTRKQLVFAFCIQLSLLHPCLICTVTFTKICLMQGPESVMLTNKQLFTFLFLLDCSMCFLKS